MTESKLRELAKAATPGEWTTMTSSHGGVLLKRGVEMPLKDRHPQGSLQIVPTEDGVFMAAANPKRVLELLAKIAKLEAEKKELEAEVQHLHEQEAGESI